MLLVVMAGTAVTAVSVPVNESVVKATETNNK
jgi:hypothetical protein